MTTNTTNPTPAETVLALRTINGAYESYDRMSARERRHATSKHGDTLPVDKRLEVLDTEALRLRVDMDELETVAREQMEDDHA